MEQWRQVVGWPAYEVSNCGNVRRIAGQRVPRNGRQRRPKLCKNGYLSVALWSKIGVLNDKPKHCLVHRLVAAAFLGEAKGRDVNHLNANRADNRVENLEYVTKLQNVHHCMSLGRHTRGTKINCAKLNEMLVREIRRRAAEKPFQQIHLAREFGVSASVVSKIVLRQGWAWVD